MQKSVLIVEDEAAIREMVAGPLSLAGFRALEARDASEAEHILSAEVPSLILLDWMLPGISGVEFARRLRREEATREVPIIMLTARGEEDDKLAGFNAGIDDYISKPFSLRELVARVKAVIKRSGQAGEEEPLTADGLSLDPVSHRVTAEGAPVKTGPTEFRLLQFLMSHPDRVFTRGQILDRVWGRNVYVEERTVDVHVRRLRKILSPSGHERLIQTVHGTGYRFSRHP
ncbi:MAG: phosphate regulon transcriptional regulatory protein PhoB [Gammaproteobacteria bacterium]|nr:phosphate regulon transcriptional regulatory protein PhoB [Gammaproteobacteria bacterium]NIR84034.1 phosphate regulon transcriptional regulatory protein PhoB [Gammaproteobacteria bacterium]NIR89178.1 phosphate regulon transcriptional regulatory protein PhoB [Gammaproteobacteria bacterium]NIU04980.1 phosphate regulon transcriptional regulatory protein PhoB [Gammaproteobacteria bacterium]NIV52146.1 phosphate regulon transcriptional regulatory protein PhoB [Gammaproteobacteria bacterium]